MSTARRLVIVLLAIAVAVGGGVALVVSGVVGGDDGPPDADGPATAPTSATPTTVPPTPLADFDTRFVALERAEFCDAVDADAVERALGGPVTQDATWRDGQQVELAPGVSDVAHEFGCVWSTDRVVARAWVFAPPVAPGEAQDLVAAAREDEDCGPLGGAEGAEGALGAQGAASESFGAPSVGLVCRTGRGHQASYRGLFGDAWLTCVVGGRLSRDDVAARIGPWCVAVAQAATTPTS